jgi:CRISPR-associated protein (TIGR03986 family)
MTDFLNPYNFVRVLPPPTVPDDPECHLLWRCPPPPHDRFTGLSGRISCRLKVVTPLFVSDSVDSKRDQDTDEHQIHNFFNVDGKPIIPGSSLRGPIRSVFEAVTNSTMGVFDTDGDPLFYRLPPENALGLVPAIVEVNERSNVHLRLLPGMLDIQISSKNLYAAWIPRYRNTDKLAQADQRKHRHVLHQQDIVDIPQDCRDGNACWGAVRKTTNRDKGFPHQQVDFIATDRNSVQNWSQQQSNKYRVVQGYVYSTGLNIDLKQYERFFFAHPSRQPEYASLNREVADQYDALIIDYASRAEEIQNSLTTQSQSGRTIRPSDFIRSPKLLNVGSLVYASLEKSDNEFVAKALYPVNVSRAAYNHPVRDLLDKHIVPCENIDDLCLASRVFGWVSPKADKELAYAGRVQFSHATAEEVKFLDRDITLQILGSPHPTAVEFYLDIDRRDILPQQGHLHGYDAPDASLRGRKMYRHHTEFNADEATTEEHSKFNRTLRKVVLPESTFTFKIDFKNLQPVELGALLWTLQLDDGRFKGHHRMGYGKPLGMGSVKIEIAGLEVWPTRNRYLDPLADGTELVSYDNEIETLMGRFVQKFEQLYGQGSFYDLPNIKDLQALLDAPTVKLPIHYPRLPDSEKNFEWFMRNKRSKRPVQLSLSADDRGLPRNPTK